MEQQKLAVNFLDTKAVRDDVIFAGDMNWNDQRDGPMHFAPGKTVSTGLRWKITKGHHISDQSEICPPISLRQCPCAASACRMG